MNVGYTKFKSQKQVYTILDLIRNKCFIYCSITTKLFTNYLSDCMPSVILNIYLSLKALTSEIRAVHK